MTWKVRHSEQGSATLYCFVCRCYAALGDMAKARYLEETNRIAEEASEQMVGDTFVLLSPATSVLHVVNPKHTHSHMSTLSRASVNKYPNRCLVIVYSFSYAKRI